MPKHIHVLRLAIVALFAITAVFYFPFTAEDAFITYRYAANLATLGSLVFNQGEPIMALTSPLHGVVASLMFRFTGSPIIANKIMGLVLLGVIAALLYRRYGERPRVQLLVAALVLLPPSILLWTFGGLETPLLLFLATSIVLLADEEAKPGLGRLCAVLVLAGLAFVTRYDSVLFTVPVVLHALWRSGSLRHAAVAVALGAVLPVTWLAISSGYYGDIFPTSYYAKRPGRSIPVLIHNGKYVLSYLVFVGIIPAVGLILGLLGTPRNAANVWFQHARRYWWLYAAVGAQLAYGLTMATTHMMFSFRSFVPYIPAAAILLGDLTRDVLDRPRSRETAQRSDLIVTAAVLFLVVFQAFQAVYTYKVSVNGLSRHGEYPWVGVAQYNTFIRTLRSEGENIRRHWASLSDRPDRLPRIYTYAGGVVPYTFRESYVYETLVSYRHCTEPQTFVSAPNVWMRTAIDLRSSADYVHLLTPRHGEIGPQLPLPEEHFTLISAHEVEFDGQPERFLVFFNPTPEAHRLVPRIDGGCRGMAPAE